MRKLLIYLKGYGRESVLAPLFKMLEASFELIVPLVVAAIIDTGIAGENGRYIAGRGALLILLGVIGLCCSITAQYFSAKAAVGFATKLRMALFSHIQKFSFSDMDEIGTATMVTRMTSDVNQVQSGVNLVLRLFLRSPFIVFGAILMAYTIDAGAALIFAGAVALLSLVVFGVMLAGIPLYRRVQAGLDGILGITRENLTGARVIRAFHREEAETRRFEEKNRALMGVQLFAGRVSAVMNPLTYVLVNGAVILLIRSGASKVETGLLTQGEVVALVNYMSQILVELVKLANLIITVTKAMACAKRVEGLLEVSPGEGETASREIVGREEADDGMSVVFDHVCLTYRGAGAEALSDIDFAVRRGETVGIIGGTGAGKSSLVNLLPRFYEATEGCVKVDGRDVRDYPVEELRGRLGVVMQRAVLFKGTIRENLLWGKGDASDEELWQALDTAQAREFVEKKTGGLDAVVEQEGRNLSGGQKQRLAIARALVRKPEILILDDSSSALDFATDAALRKAIRETAGEATVFIVSQRAASLRLADRIVVMEDGHIAGIGTHDELLSSCPVYREIHDSQFRKEGSGR